MEWFRIFIRDSRCVSICSIVRPYFDVDGHNICSSISGYSLVTYNDYVIMMGGTALVNGEARESYTICKYQFDRWFNMGSLYAAREGHSAIIHENNIIVFGGRDKQ